MRIHFVGNLRSRIFLDEHDFVPVRSYIMAFQHSDYSCIRVFMLHFSGMGTKRSIQADYGRSTLLANRVNVDQECVRHLLFWAQSAFLMQTS